MHCHSSTTFCLVYYYGYYTVYQKINTDVAHYNFNAHQLILVILAEMLLREYAIKR